MKLLSTLAAIRLDEDGDNIENTLSLALVDTAKPGTTDRSIQSLDPLASSSWERVRKLCVMCHVSVRAIPSPYLKSLSTKHMFAEECYSRAGSRGENFNYPSSVQKFVEAIQSWNGIYSHTSHSGPGIATCSISIVTSYILLITCCGSVFNILFSTCCGSKSSILFICLLSVLKWNWST